MAIFRSKALSRHALFRCYERNIPISVVYFVVKHGKSLKTRRVKKSFISQKLLKILQKDHNSFISRYDKQLTTTVVIWSQETIITCIKN